MKYLLSLVFLVLFAVNQSFGQEEPNYLGFYLGTGIPLSSYKQQNLYDDPSYMKAGIYFGLNGAYYLTENFGFAASFMMDANSDDLAAIEIDMEAELDALSGNLHNVIYDTDGWGGVHLMLGPSMKVGDKIIAELYAVGGMYLGTSADLIVGVESSTGFVESAGFATKVTPGYGGRAGINFRYVKGRMSLALLTGYTYGSVKFPVYYTKAFLIDHWKNGESIIEASNTIDAAKAPEKASFVFQTINLAVGVNYQFTTIRSWRAIKRREREKQGL